MEATYTTLSRLCIEMNRSEDHPQLFSAYTRSLPAARKMELLHLYHAYRNSFTERIKERIAAKMEVVHVAVHSYTPLLNGVRRNLDIGLLYDPSRPSERSFCLAWRKAIKVRMPAFTVRMNQPYKGTSNGFPTTLRQQFIHHYSGIELEVNQRFTKNGSMDKALTSALLHSLSEVLASTGRYR